MKIKSLLIGSAAALVAATGAKAADAVVVAEPEPVEYVRVCDAYGAGFFYIPGTETCLSISGYVWFQVAGSRANRLQFPGLPATDNFSVVTTRARVNIDARSDTEWGTLRGFIRLQSDWNAQNQTTGTLAIPGIPGVPLGLTLPFVSTFAPGDGNVVIDQAFIELGGLRMGYSESAWNQTQGGGNSNWGSHSWAGLGYGYQQRQLIAYTFQGGNGFFGTLSLEDDGNANWLPDVVAKFGVNQGWGSVWAKVAYDEDTGPAALIPGILGLMPLNPFPAPVGMSGLSGWGASVGAHFNIPNMPGDSLRLIGFYANRANAYSVGARWSVLASYQHAFSSALSASVGFQYMGDTNFATAGTPSAWQAELAIVWFPVENFEVRTEITHVNTNPLAGANTNVTSGFLRFTRYF